MFRPSLGLHKGWLIDIVVDEKTPSPGGTPWRETGLSGPIPPELGMLLDLKELALTSDKLSGPIPPELGNLTKLERLHLHGIYDHGSQLNGGPSRLSWAASRTWNGWTSRGIS